MEKLLRVCKAKRPVLMTIMLSLAIVMLAWGGAIAAPQYSLICSSCHGMPPLDSAVRDKVTGAFPGNHQTHQPTSAVIANCAVCHNASGYTSSHMNGQISFQASLNSSPATGQYKVSGVAVSFKNQTSVPVLGTCSNVNCHFEAVSPQWGSTPLTYTSATVNDCDKCHGLPSNTGSHSKHVNTFGSGTSTCAICHPNHAAETAKFAHATSASAGHRDLIVTFTGAPNGTGTYAGSTKKSYPNYLPSGTGSYGQCSNLYCHGSATATWGVASTAACGSCHSVNNLLQGKHAQHYGSATFGATTSANNSSSTAYNYNCGVCHYKAPHGLGAANPPNQTANIAFSADIAGGGSYAPGATGYTDSQTTWKYTNGSCSATYCHSQGRNIFGTYSAPKTTAFDWSTGSTLTCAGCHGDASTAGKLLTTGKHQQHVNNAAYLGTNFGCVDCHASTVSSNSVISNKVKHVNKFVDYSGARAGKNKNCSNIYCHSDGKATYATIPAWNSAALPSGLACNACHANTSLSHPKHVVTNSISCDRCHNATAASSTALRANTTTHINGTYNISGTDVKFASFSSAWKATYSGGGKTCNTIYCHSNGKGAYQAVTWGSALTCNSCHPFSSLSAGHAKHIDLTQTSVFYNYTANRSSGDEGLTTAMYRFGCSNCHPTDEATYHTNGVIDVTLRPATGAGSLRNKNINITADGINVAGSHIFKTGSTLTCDNVYCHTNGYAASTNWSNTTPAWTGSFANADRCANCHGNSPSVGIAGSAAHAAHVVGIHADDVFSGTNGKLSAGTGGTGGNTTAVGHGSSVQATTINCNICHYATVTYARNDRNPSCSTTGCHATPTNLAQINNRANHVNGRVDVSFQSIAVVSKAQLRPTSFANYTAAGGYWNRNAGHYKDGGLAYDTAKNALSTATMWNGTTENCSNIACHMGKSVNWNSSLSCVDCHNNL